jgi:hypothetical protein
MKLTMKPRRIPYLLIVPAALVLLAIGCSDDEAITYSVTDVSSRVTGFSNTRSGPGAQLTINGSQLGTVQRMFLGTQKVAAKDFIEHTESAITFTVPTSATPNVNGEKTDVLLVFNGSERAYNEIELVPLQAISSFTPYTASAGETVTLIGVNFNLVTGVRLGSVDATITSQSPTVLKFTMPNGAPTGKITLIGEAGNSNSATDLTSCSASPSGPDCTAGLNLNTSFEAGSGDNFDNWNKQNGGTLMTATTSPSEVFGGDRAVKVTRDGTLGSGQWRIQLVTAAVPTDIGASYTVYLWAKASVAGGALRVSTNPGGPSDQYTGDQAVTTQWQRLAFTFASIATGSTRVSLDMNGNNTVATTFFIDDVKLVKN